ncbi:MAG: IS200/IS605 family transposase, partial [bacterium]|nr:IS200/IS605 family transposase [bacterium]
MKPDTFTQLYVHLIFAVQHRQYLLHDPVAPRVFKYMSGIVRDLKHKSMIVNGMPDHVHLLLGLHPSVSISDTVHDIKRGSSLWINQERMFRGKFAWQEGYGAFSYSRSQLNDVYHYIENQQEHHRRRTFREEYVDFLEKFALEYDA